MSLIWAPSEKPPRKPRGRVLPFITRWRAPLEVARPERILPPAGSEMQIVTKTPIPITVKLRVRY